MSSKFAPDVPKSLIDAVSSIMNEAKADELPPIDKTEAQKRKERQAKLDAIEDKRAERDAGKEKPKSAVTKVSGTQYGGSKQKDPVEVEEELSPKQKKIAAMAGDKGKIDADDLAALRSGKKPGCDTCDEETVEEKHMTDAEMAKREKIVKSMKKGLAGFKARYGSKAKNVMYATATKQSMKSEETITEGIVNHADIAKDLVKKHGKNVTMDHIDDYIDGADDAHKVDKREVLHHIKLLQDMNCESVQITEGKLRGMGAVYTDMMDHATKKGYTNKKQFTKADYETIGKQNGVSGADIAIVAGHHTADSYSKLKEASEPKKIEPPFTPDKKPKKIAVPGKHGYGPSAASHLAHLGMKSLQKNSFDPDLSEGTGGPIYTKPLVKLGDLLARAKDMKNIKQATIVNPKDENQVAMKKEDVESTEDRHKREDEEERERKRKEQIAKNNKAFVRAVKRQKTPGASLGIAKDIQQRYYKTGKWEEVSIVESIEVKKEYDDKDETEHGVYHNGKKIGYVVHHKPSNTHTAYHSPSSYDKKGHADDYEEIDDFHNHKDAVNQIKSSALDETYMGKAGCTSEDDKKKDKKPVDYDKPTFLRKKDDWRKSNLAHLPKPTKEDVELDERVITPGTGTSPDPLLARTGLNKVLRKPRVGQTNLKNIPGGNLPGSQYKFSDDEKTKQRASLKTAIKSTLANKEHGVKRKLPEEIEQLDELDPKTYASYANKAVGDTTKDRSKMIKVADKKLYGNPDLRYKSEGFNTFKGVAAEIKAGTFSRSKPDLELAKQKKKDLESSFENKTKKRTEEVSIDETATLDKYIRSMGYDPQHLDKNKKVMFAKTNAYKTFASSQKTEGLYDGGQKGTQDIDDHMSPGATARG